MSQTLAAIPQFVRFLGTFPPPQAVVEALARGPLAHLGAASVVVSEFRDDDNVLVTLGAVGQTPEEAERYGVIPMDVELPITQALRSRTVVAVSVAKFGPEYVGGFDAELSDRMVDRLGDVVLVSVPIVHAGQIVGGWGFVTTRPWDELPEGSAVVDAVSSILGMWMTHPRAGLAHLTPPASRGWSLAFTPRQREVLRRVEDGEPTSQMAAELGVSESSVKADLQAAMRALRTSDRREAAERARMLGLL